MPSLIVPHTKLSHTHRTDFFFRFIIEITNTNDCLFLRGSFSYSELLSVVMEKKSSTGKVIFFKGTKDGLFAGVLAGFKT